MELAALSDSVSGVDVVQTAAIMLAALGVVLTALQVRRESRSANQARQAELSWSMYVAYSEPDIRRARSRTEALANSPDCPADARDYQAQVADGWPWVGHVEGTIDADVRRLLRFYNQLAVLLRQRLIDDDFVFRLVGVGLQSAWPALSPAIAYYQYFYGHGENRSWRARPRPLYVDIHLLRDRSVTWVGPRSRVQPSRAADSGHWIVAEDETS